MINKSKLFSAIKLNLGMYALHLPFDLNELMEDILDLDTLPTYSELFPLQVEKEVNFSSMKKLDGNYSHSVYQLPDFFPNQEIITILSIDPVGSDISRNGIIGDVDMFETIIMGQVKADLASLISDKMTFDFEAPNRVHIYNLDTASDYKFRLKFGLSHTSSLVTIPRSQFISFKQLFDLDVKATLYNNMKHYSTIQTQHGVVDLKIDDWADAASKKEELIREWTNVYHLEQEPLFII